MNYYSVRVRGSILPMVVASLVAGLCTKYCVAGFFFRGETFRREFANLGELRSLIPVSVRVVALSATATVDTRKAICTTLGMVNTVVVAESPNASLTLLKSTRSRTVYMWK